MHVYGILMLSVGRMSGLRCVGCLTLGGLFGSVFHHVIGGLWSAVDFVVCWVFCSDVCVVVAKMLYCGWCCMR